MIPSKMWPKDVVHAFHLRAQSESGIKDWVCIISSNPFHSKHLWVVFGKTAEVLNGGGQGRALTKTSATEAELVKAVREKLNGKDKYEIVDEYEARCGWHKAPSSQTSAPAPPAAPSQPPLQAAKTTPPPPPQPAKAKAPEVEDPGEPTMCW